MAAKLNILIANWTWFPSGGDWTYIENLCKFYESFGHTVIPFSMENEKNFPSPYSEYFIKNIDYRELNKNKTLLSGLRAVKNSIYSTEARAKLRLLLDRHQIDIVHLNNIHHYLTPASIIPEIKKKNIPIIWTLHDYVILCPNTTFISHETVCEKCKGGKFYQCIVNKCKKQSLPASFVAALESYANETSNPYQYVDYFICPSEFIRKKFEAFGFESHKLRQVYNLFDIESVSGKYEIPPGKNDRPYIIYVGNILKVKGIFTLVKAVAGLDLDLKVIGSGEHFDELKDLVDRNHIQNVELLGKMPKETVFRFVQHALFVVVPSEWYENLPYSLVEALLLAKPVLGADIGGIPELVINDVTGQLFKPANAADLRLKIQMMISDKDKLIRMGKDARKHAMNLVNYDTFAQHLSPIFESLELAL
ncbi:MAG TPA: glycosyltransferase family 4 protein [Puia sp.]|jgi:glycosyltransferase involved in cell wall biosynthesis|nr:glycosyltransferase family 4 protein [Puia sp.]